MKSRGARKKEEQRRRAKEGRRVLPAVEIADWQTWIGVLEEEGRFRVWHQRDHRAVKEATESFIADLCREHSRKKAEALLQQARAIRIGPLERAANLPFDDTPRLIKKSKPARQKPTAPVEDTNPWHLDFELPDRLEEMLAEEDENPQTGEWRRKDTSHDVERDE